VRDFIGAIVLFVLLLSASAPAAGPSAQEHASFLARMGRLVHSSCNRIEGIGMGQTREQARRNCCYFGTRPIVEEGTAYSPTSRRWYAVIRYREEEPVDIVEQLRGFHPWATFTGVLPMTVCQDAADEIDRLRASYPRWRSITEPPPPGQPVLLFTDHLDGFVWIGRRGLLPPDVTHWMPLPGPPATFKG
jgi:hypothetical protein